MPTAVPPAVNEVAAGSAQRHSSSTSCADSTSLAPCLMSAWQPRDCGAWIEPGIANTSRPCSVASLAVISEPDARAASTTSVPCDRPEMMRLRLGKLGANGGVPRGYSLTSKPCRAMRCAKSRWRLGYTRSNPVPTTAMVVGASPSFRERSGAIGARAPSWAAASTPSARPETIVSPVAPNAFANW